MIVDEDDRDYPTRAAPVNVGDECDSSFDRQEANEMRLWEGSRDTGP